MAPNEDDSTAIANTKSAILNNISGRYSEDVYHCLLECTALDPRFRALPQLDHGQREAVFLRVQDKAKQLEQNQVRPYDFLPFIFQIIIETIPVCVCVHACACVCFRNGIRMSVC